MMRLQLLDQRGQLVGALDDDSRMLGYYPVEDYMTIHVWSGSRSADCATDEHQRDRRWPNGLAAPTVGGGQGYAVSRWLTWTPCARPTSSRT